MKPLTWFANPDFVFFYDSHFMKNQSSTENPGCQDHIYFIVHLPSPIIGKYCGRRNKWLLSANDDKSYIVFLKKSSSKIHFILNPDMRHKHILESFCSALFEQFREINVFFEKQILLMVMIKRIYMLDNCCQVISIISVFISCAFINMR